MNGKLLKNAAWIQGGKGRKDKGQESIEEAKSHQRYKERETNQKTVSLPMVFIPHVLIQHLRFTGWRNRIATGKCHTGTNIGLTLRLSLPVYVSKTF